MNGTHSIWNENPETYFLIKRFYSAIISIIYPFAHYCVLWKSPSNFGFLKFFIYFHTLCFTVEWLSNAFLIDVFDFQPSVALRLIGFLAGRFDSVLLYSTTLFIEGVSTTSALLLFTSRLFLIANMYCPSFSCRRIAIEGFIYILVVIFGTWSIPMAILEIPEQISAKRQIVQDEKYYPDCLWDADTVVVSGSLDSGSEQLLSMIAILNWVSIGIAILASAKIAFWILSKKMVNKSAATKRMHKKFNQRTIFQAFIYLSFSCVPFSVLYLTILFDIYIPGITYFIDLASENHPTACAVCLFLYYDPYQNALLNIFRINTKVQVIKSSTLVIERQSNRIF